MAAEVRGIVVTAMRSFLEATYGAVAVEQAIAALPQDEAALLERKFLDASFYPYRTMIALRHAMRAVATRHARAAHAADDFGIYLADYVFTGPYKPLLAKNVQSMLAKIGWVKDFFYRDCEKVETSMWGESSCRLTYRYEDAVKPARAVCRSLATFWARTLELAGAENVKWEHPVCVCDGADRCDFSFSW